MKKTNAPDATKNTTATHKKWMQLDNAAKIYPAAKRRDWTALFRLSAELTEAVDPQILFQAQCLTLLRFPGFALQLKRGLFWYYLEQNHGAPEIRGDVGNPCVRMKPSENDGFLFRLRYYERRIALEVYHVLSDGGGGICFMKTLLAEYLRLKYGAEIPRGDEILDCNELAQANELEDSYIKYARKTRFENHDKNSYYLSGTPETDDFIHITSGIIPVKDILAQAKKHGISLTGYLTAVMITAIDKIQREEVRQAHRLHPVKVCVPVNLRAFYPSSTMRNFSYFVNIGIEPKYGKYNFEEIIQIVHHQMGLEVTEKMLNARFSSNVRSEQSQILRIMPLFIKNFAMRMVFNRVGDRKTSTCLSNMGNTSLPAEMAKYITRMDAILGPLSRNKVVCATISCNGNLIIDFTRTMKESILEKEFFRILVKEGIHVKIETNAPLTD